MPKRIFRPSPAVLIAVLALFVALGGPSYAAKQITGKQIKNNSVTGKDIKNNSLTGKDIKDGSLSAKDLAPTLLTARAIPMKRVAATNGSTASSAQANAPEVTLFSAGPLSVYGKCWHDTTNNDTYYATFIKSSTSGSIFDSRSDELSGGRSASDFLNPTTDEDDRELEGDDVGADEATMDADDESDFTAFAKDGTALRGFTGGAVKNGNAASGNGPFGPGNVCLFTGGYFVG
jgi:hypothetical protein